MKKIIAFLVLLYVTGVSAQNEYSVYFDSNKYQAGQEQLGFLANWLNANKDSKVVAINGYTDEDGTTKFNDTLAQRRVDYVFSLIKDKIKIRDDFKTRSFGEKHQMSPDKAKNRKVTIYYLRPEDLPRENEILGIKEEPKEVVKIDKQKIRYPDRIMVQGPQGREEIKLDTVFMKKITLAKPGENLRIENLNFYENTFAIMPDSRPKLYELLAVMQANPGLKIKLEGHVCCMTADRRHLSTDRAKAIMMFLNRNGIEKSRLSFEGFGVSKPLYPIPEKTPEEREANRRVEVVIVENP
ncbi:OmpA family protein [Flavobacterium rhizosphaerae]|uniref:OmpA family protein n=1 Tax=Flavobacterium rhizosphaerae TaxID=3163298 RepID=A0ABW8YVN7_9FLAO